jgi:hypothetical protein
MRILLILLIVAAIFAVVQSQRHNCTFGDAGWFDCVLGKSATTPATTTPTPPAGTPPATTDKPPATQP